MNPPKEMSFELKIATALFVARMRATPNLHDIHDQEVSEYVEREIKSFIDDNGGEIAFFPMITDPYYAECKFEEIQGEIFTVVFDILSGAIYNELTKTGKHKHER